MDLVIFLIKSESYIRNLHISYSNVTLVIIRLFFLIQILYNSFDDQFVLSSHSNLFKVGGLRVGWLFHTGLKLNSKRVWVFLVPPFLFL